MIAAERNILGNAEHILCSLSLGAAAGITHAATPLTNAPFTVHVVAALPSAAAAVVPSDTPHRQHYEQSAHSVPVSAALNLSESRMFANPRDRPCKLGTFYTYSINY